jgi:hypothetical protein
MKLIGTWIVVYVAMKISKWNLITVLVVFAIISSQVTFAAAVRLTWQSNAESDLAGYRVYYGSSSHSYTSIKDVGLSTTTDINGFTSGTTYYFAISAYDNSGNESDLSDEIIAVIPADSGNEEVGRPVDSDADGIPDSVETLWGLDPNNPLDSLEDFDGDGAINLVEYMNSTNPNNVSDKPATDEVLKDIIAVVDSPITLTSINPTGSYSIVPLMAGIPGVINNSLTIPEPGTYLYNVVDADGNIIYRLRVSVTSRIFAQGSFTPGTPLSIQDLSLGISIQLRSDANTRNVPIGLGDTTVGALTVVSNDATGIEFDVLPYGLALAQPATITVNFEKTNPIVQRYDEEDRIWKTITSVTISGNQISFSTQELGKFRVYSEEAVTSPQASSASPAGSSGGGGGGGGGGCFISTAGI